jgi:hypothetical protein
MLVSALITLFDELAGSDGRQLHARTWVSSLGPVRPRVVLPRLSPAQEVPTLPCLAMPLRFEVLHLSDAIASALTYFTLRQGGACATAARTEGVGIAQFEGRAIDPAAQVLCPGIK